MQTYWFAFKIHDVTMNFLFNMRLKIMKNLKAELTASGILDKVKKYPESFKTLKVISWDSSGSLRLESENHGFNFYNVDECEDVGKILTEQLNLL